MKKNRINKNSKNIQITILFGIFFFFYEMTIVLKIFNNV